VHFIFIYTLLGSDAVFRRTVFYLPKHYTPLYLYYPNIYPFLYFRQVNA